MTDRKLYLVKTAPGEEPPEAPASSEEARAAEAVRDAVERGDEPISSSLKAAHAPEALTEPDHEALLARALGDLDAPPTEAEREAAARLRNALERSGAPAPLPSALDAELDAELLRELRHTAEPAPLAAAAHDAMLARVLEDPLAPPQAEELEGAEKLRHALESARGVPAIVEALRAAERPRLLDPARNEALIEAALSRGARRRGRVVTLVVSALAMAAALAMIVPQALRSPAPVGAPASAATASLIRARSTTDLFDAAEPFPRSGGESQRMDRIVSARTADLRANRFKAWGVR